ncbi:MAG: M48 family metallopeptidase [Clostridia bacterium]|nr:M48 family metallopeptidase [Clostridia bacterium]
MVGIYFVCQYNGFGTGLSIFLALIFSIIPAIISYYNCDKMVLALNGARPATREQDLQLSVILENLCIASGLPKPKLYVIQENSPNAFATGRNPQNAVICVTTGLLEKLDKYELEGVVAHELAHIKNYDILLSTIVSVFVGIVVMLSDVMTRYSFRTRRRSSNDNNSSDLIVSLIAIVFLILSPIFATLMQLAISRKREFLADATAVEFTRNPQGLIDALVKISSDSDTVVDTANKSTAHMYISSPLKEKKQKESDFWSTHPSTERRIDALRNIH